MLYSAILKISPYYYVPICIQCRFRKFQPNSCHTHWGSRSESAYTHLLGITISLVMYSVEDELCARFIRDARSHPSLNYHLESDIFDITSNSLSLSP